MNAEKLIVVSKRVHRTTSDEVERSRLDYRMFMLWFDVGRLEGSGSASVGPDWG